MKEDIEKRIRAAGSVKLTAAEKSELGANFAAFMDAHPEAAPAWVPQWRLAYAGALAVLALIAYVGISEASLPGDTLYFFKTSVNENVVRSVALTRETRAGISVAMLERRLEEAEKLGMRGEAAANAWSVLSKGLDRAAGDASEEIGELAESDDAAAAVAVTSERNGVMGAHEEVLEEISGFSESSEIDGVIAALRGYKEAAEKESVLVSTRAATSGDAASVAGESGKELEALVREVRDRAVRERESGDADTAAHLDAAAEFAEALISSGSAALESGDAGTALAHFAESRSALVESAAIADAEEELGLDVDAAASGEDGATR